MRAFVVIVVLAASHAAPVTCAGEEIPWWKEQKIRFMWGCWGLAGADKSTRWEGRDVPREVFRDVARSGATVYSDTWYYKASHARLAKEFGVRVFAPTHLGHMTWKPGGRTWINEEGKEVEKYPESTGQLHRCPLDAFVYERWLVGDEKMAGIREGIIDGIHVDWESTEAGICYCDDCFSTFLKIKAIKAEPQEKAKRVPWLQGRDLVGGI